MLAPLIGIDLVEPVRLMRKLRRTPSLERRLFTVGELAYCRATALPYQHLAARFSAKEAVTKALALRAFEPLDVEVLDGGELCAVALHGDARARASELAVQVTVSLTHIQGVAGAVALARPCVPIAPDLSPPKRCGVCGR